MSILHFKTVSSHAGDVLCEFLLAFSFSFRRIVLQEASVPCGLRFRASTTPINEISSDCDKPVTVIIRHTVSSPLDSMGFVLGPKGCTGKQPVQELGMVTTKIWPVFIQQNGVQNLLPTNLRPHLREGGTGKIDGRAKNYAEILLCQCYSCYKCHCDCDKPRVIATNGPGWSAVTALIPRDPSDPNQGIGFQRRVSSYQTSSILVV